MPRRKGQMQQDVLTALRAADRPQSAYDLLETMRAGNPRVAPTAIYRALDALSETGAIHRLESLKSYVACQGGDHSDDCIMAICQDCGGVEEHVAPSAVSQLSQETAKSGFAPSRHVIELHGQCAACRPEAS